MKKISRWNRGLLIGAVLIAGVIIFQITDQVRFQKSVPSISGSIQDYMTDCTAAIANAEDPAAARLRISGDGGPVLERRHPEQQLLLHHQIRFLRLSVRLRRLRRIRPVGGGAAGCGSVRHRLQDPEKTGRAPVRLLSPYEQTSYLDRYGTYLTPFYMDYAYDTQSETGGDETPSSVTDGEDAIRVTSQQQVLLQLYEENGEWRIATASLQQGYSDSAIVKRTEVPGMIQTVRNHTAADTTAGSSAAGTGAAAARNTGAFHPASETKPWENGRS